MSVKHRNHSGYAFDNRMIFYYVKKKVNLGIEKAKSLLKCIGKTII